MNILDNELVKKYFKCEHSWKSECSDHMAFRVLQAMQEPISKGERFIMTPCFNEEVWDQPNPIEFHPYYLRLPNNFQTLEDNIVDVYWNCPNCSYRCYAAVKDILIAVNAHRKEQHQPAPDAVEDKIKEIKDTFPSNRFPFFEQKLRERVRVARENGLSDEAKADMKKFYKGDCK